ncbi:hypothetical protein [Aerolutibacter ruishenii]|nr:hypothetical protein [Lysobacter ruishenii]
MRLGTLESDAGRAANIAEKRAKQIDAAFTKAGAAMGASIAAGAGIAAVAIKRTIDEADNFSKMASKIGIATESLTRLDYAAKLSDVSMEQLSGAVRKLGQNQLEALQGGKQYAALFKQLGIEVGSAKNGIRDAGGVITELADVFAKMPDGANKTALAIKLFGKSGADMIPLLNSGSKALQDFADKSDEVGYTLSGTTGKAAEEFNDKLTEVKLGIDGLWRQALPQLLPKLSEFADVISSPDFRDGFATIINGSITAVGALVKFTTTLANTTKFVGEELAARFNGPSLDDQVRVAEKLARLRKTEGEFAQIQRGQAPNLGNITEMKPGDFLRPVADVRKRLQAEIADYEQRLKISQQLGEDAAARAAKIAEDAAKAITVPDWTANTGAAKRTAKGGKSEAQRQMEEAAKAAEALTEAQDNARRTLEDWRAELDGPAAQALLKYSRMERDLDEQVAAGEISWKQYADAMGMVSEMRAKDEALMTDQQKAAKALAEAQADAAAEYERTWRGAVESVSYAFADFIAGGINSFKDFGRALKDIARRMIADIIGQFANNALQSTVGNWLRGITSGGFSQAGGQGGWMQMLSQMFGGGSGGGLSSIGGWLGNLFGGGSSAAAGSLYGFGNVSNLAGVAGASSTLGGGAAAGGSSGAMSGLASIPVVGWIIAGMMANSAMFDKGWDIGNGESWAGKIATLGAVGNADKLFRKLGLDNKTASILSGSSIHAALFGRKKPEIKGQGLMGSIGFDGLDGKMFADIVEKGGLFRSDKKYSRYGDVDPEIDSAFDVAARQVYSGATALAKQLGVDLTAQLAGVKIDLGKVKLDKDPEKAQAQLEKLLMDMVERLAGESVKAAGFQHLLDDGFKAGEIMNALSVSIGLVSGSAEDLGRALNDVERAEITQAVEWFERLANVNGTELAAEIERVVGTLSAYSDLMTGVETQLLTAGLNDYQRAQLDVEMGYRAQVKQANDLAKSLGLSGARAEDLAKIEQLRAVNMAALQKQYEAQKDNFLQDLGLSDLSPMRDDQKLASSMQMLREAVGAGDLQRAQQLSQQALGFGRNLYASGADYNGLYGEVTGLLGGMTGGALDGFTETGLDNIADILEGLPDEFARALFREAALATPVTPPLPTTPPPLQPPGGTTGGTGGDDSETNRLLRRLITLAEAQTSIQQSDSLNRSLNGMAVV